MTGTDDGGVVKCFSFLSYFSCLNGIEIDGLILIFGRDGVGFPVVGVNFLIFWGRAGWEFLRVMKVSVLWVLGSWENELYLVVSFVCVPKISIPFIL